ncbi:type II toxin-antitoxin system PemK/MazF family toxin [Algoriphagus confluentis]|uniref:Type II toxin-antitoxin system PemK/MazF family toxin n=1 Tax=Algoriphagus confluentis TaxID=1697556 RepID=A0ABQ6PQB8_9BACT|nr:type II toxin-antitoxin system PemK/MazF family toxin [Algoriphagus confluentis]
MKKGDLILIPFPFSDLTGAKNRPALVLISNELDVTVSFITSQIKWSSNHDIVLFPSLLNGIKVKSLVRLSKMATVSKDLILGKLGELSQKELNDVDKGLIDLFHLKP